MGCVSLLGKGKTDSTAGFADDLIQNRFQGITFSRPLLEDFFETDIPSRIIF